MLASGKRFKKNCRGGSIRDMSNKTNISKKKILGILIGFGLLQPIFVLATPTLSVSLGAFPSSGCFSLSGVDLIANVSGTASGNINYFFDCTNDGLWEKIISSYNSSYIASHLCSYSSLGTYTAKVRVEREGLSAENTTQINVYSCSTLPTVDIKANNSDGPIAIPYNSSANLTWNSTDVDSCQASGDWSGSKPISGSESTGNLTSSKTYTITCSNSGGSASDSVAVNISQSTFSLSLSANPSSGCPPLSGVDLTANVSGTTGENITYFFDCTNDGSWEKIYTTSDTYYTAYDLCYYSSLGNYTARARAERQGVSAENTTQINVYSCYSSPTVDIKANNSDGSITIPYNNSANLSWTSSNTNYCYASGDWSGSKSLSGSESTFNLTSSKIYTLICSGSGGSVSDSVRVNIAATPTLTIIKLVRNLSDGTAWLDSVSADPSEVLSFSIQITAGGSFLQNVILRDTLPDKIKYRGNLKIDGISSSGDILSGLNIGNLSSNQTKTITFDADILEADRFAFGETQLINSALAFNVETSNSDTAKIIVIKRAVAGAATGISTGLTNNPFLDSFLLPLVIALIIIWLFKSHILQIEEWLDLRKKKYQEYHSQKLLKLKVAQIKLGKWFRNLT